MMPWVWGLQVAETIPWEVSLLAGLALGEAKGAGRALGAARARTEKAANQKEEIAERPLQVYSQLYPKPIWTRGFCQTPDGDRRP